MYYRLAKEMCRNGDLLRCTEAFEDYTVLTSIVLGYPFFDSISLFDINW